MDRLSDAYAKAGVNVGAAERAVDRVRAAWPMTTFDRYAGLGEFGAVAQLPDELDKPLMVTSTDGVGTKTEIARRLGRFDTIGQDLVAMCADDVVCHGAQPTYFLDYIAIGKVDEERVSTLIGGVAKACADIGCVLVGGETAEHPGVMPPEDFDLAGFCIGFVETDLLIDRTMSHEGDAIIGLASSGLHSNGHSLVRKLLDEGKLPLTDELLTPTRLYSTTILDLVEKLRAEGLGVGGLAHITGGGLRRNLPRALPDELGADVDPSTWPQPHIFETIALATGMPGSEMRATFNCGIGFAVVVAQEAVDFALTTLEDAGVEAWDIGTVRSTADLDNERYFEE